MDDLPNQDNKLQYPHFAPEEYPNVPERVIELFNNRYVYTASVLTMHDENGPYQKVWVRYLDQVHVEQLDSGKRKTIDDFMEAKRSKDRNRFDDAAFFYPEQKGYFMVEEVLVKVKVEVLEVTEDIRRIAEAYEENLAQLYGRPSLRQLGLDFANRLLSSIRKQMSEM
jgi:hypothetical protein